MEKDEKYELLNYKIKTLQLILSTVIGEECIFYNFVIDNDLSQQKVSIILNSLSILNERIFENHVSSEIKGFCEGEEFDIFLVDGKPTFKKYENFIKTRVDEKLNTEYLLLSLKSQNIEVSVCDYLLENMEKNK